MLEYPIFDKVISLIESPIELLIAIKEHPKNARGNFVITPIKVAISIIIHTIVKSHQIDVIKAKTVNNGNIGGAIL